ncbi:GH39 family glycosyl hydrolase [Pseudonocardia sp.]|uniref:GH39 family glycosyl hydrolase n=1 Tax=Pseudonocardia sp. TaxID=60912 RepID=UPI003D14657D
MTAAASAPSPAREWPRWGFTHTQFSADHGEPEAVTAIVGALAQQPLVQVQPIMGWGAGNPEPSPGMYDFESLDSRMDFIRRSAGVPVITLCCAPDWMKGGQAGHTDWDEIETAPLPQHFADFAELSAVIARRYPDVRHFMVWNELKGFFDDEAGKWDAEAYTDLYNQVYVALKAVNPDIQVGGPYMGMATARPNAWMHASAVRGDWGALDRRSLDVVEYWLTHNVGADFVVVDGLATTAGGAPDEFAALGKLSAVSRWVRERTSLPLWWAEWYVGPDRPDWSADRRVALRTAALIELAAAGADTVLYWNPAPAGPGCASCLWTDTEEMGGGAPLPYLAVLQEFARSFPRGTPLVAVPEPPGVRILASPERLVAVNTTGEPRMFGQDGREVVLGPYETRWITRTAIT